MLEDDLSIQIETSKQARAESNRRAGVIRAQQIREKYPVSKAREVKAENQAMRETGTIPLAPHHEEFVQRFLSSGNAIGSYRYTFGTQDGKGNELRTGLLSFRCRRLMGTKQVRARIQHLQAKLTESHHIGREKLSRKTEQIMEQAIYEGNGELALKAVDRLARLHGLNQDKLTLEKNTIDLNINLGYTAKEIEELNRGVKLKPVLEAVTTDTEAIGKTNGA